MQFLPRVYKVFKKKNIPNINSTLFTDNFIDILNNTGSIHSSKEMWVQKMQDFNTFMKTRNIRHHTIRHDYSFSSLKLTKSQLKKCIVHDMFMFASSNWDKYLLHFLNI